jgi:ubiquinone/menaquinone biosynthesis C-methylase UbiE
MVIEKHRVLNQLSTLKSTLHLQIPNKLRVALLNLLELSRSEDTLVPPLRLRRIIGQTDFKTDRLTHLVINCNLKKTSKVLDVGCGCGRLALSLLPYLSKQGSYEGFDIIKDFIDWLQVNITKKHPNFHFQHANVWNSSYNPTGKIKASEFKFPYPNSFFDVVYLESVFTHMLPQDLENYLSEIVRVLKPNGFCSISYFLLYPERSNVIKNDARMLFYDTSLGYMIANKTIPEDAVAYPREYILNLYQKLGLVLTKPINYGNLQDVIVASKSS